MNIFLVRVAVKITSLFRIHIDHRISPRPDKEVVTLLILDVLCLRPWGAGSGEAPASAPPLLKPSHPQDWIWLLSLQSDLQFYSGRGTFWPTGWDLRWNDGSCLNLSGQEIHHMIYFIRFFNYLSEIDCKRHKGNFPR